jgi:lysophospholipase L1-like esterase
MRWLLIILPFSCFAQNATINGAGVKMSINGSGVTASINQAPPPDAPEPLTLFTSQSESFIDGFTYAADGALSVSADAVTYNGSTGKNLRFKKAGNILYHQYEYWTQTYTITFGAMTAGSAGMEAGISQGTAGIVAGFEIEGHATDANKFIIQPVAEGVNAGSATTGNTFTPGESMTLVVSRALNVLTCTLDGVTATLTLGASPYSTYLLPSTTTSFLFRFNDGEFTVTDLDIILPDSEMSLLCVGNSITQGKTATTYGGAWAQLLKTDYPDAQMFAGRSSKTAEIVTMLPAIVLLNPAKVVLMIGLNDIVTSVADATTKANYTTIVNTLVAAGITPVLVSILPSSNATQGGTIATLNTWIDTEFPSLQYIDVFSVFKNPSDNAAQTAYLATGDSYHPSNTGHTVIYNKIKSDLLL